MAQQNDPKSSIPGITVISAGAGSGKTYTLTGRLVDLLQSGIRPSGILATTFTKKAASELQERVRVRLLEAGLTEQANDLGSALIGTVHSIGTRLLQRFAFEAGVSPLVEIIADGDEQQIFNESLSQVLTQARIENMNRLADRLGLSKKTQGEPHDWRRTIRDITDVARANNFSQEVLKASKKHSWESFERLLPVQLNIDDQTWNNRLSNGIEQTIAALEANSEVDSTKTTREAIEALRGMDNQLKWRGELYWHEWVKIGKTNVGAKSRDRMEDLLELTRSHDQHRQFRADIKGFIDLVFDIASDALLEYEQYKKKRGLIDYTDMEAYVSRLLRIDSVRDILREELDLLLVDEFQDTSPIQLDIFLRLSRIAKQSIWVGDPKQSIYGFRGAEPRLMQAIINATGGISDDNILKTSWRSRADIVNAVNAIFTRSFQDLPKEQVVLEPHFSKAKEQAFECGPALIHWHFKSELDEKKVPGSPWIFNCIADQIAVLLERQTPVFNKKRDRTRPAKPGDIAVLCRNNDACLKMAEALHRNGLKAAISRNGLLETPESVLVLACLKYLLSAKDQLSVAEIQLLSGSKNLEEIVNDRLDWLHREGDNSHSRWGAEDPFLQMLDELRQRTADLSASEILLLLYDELDLRRMAVRLGNPNQVLDNMDRLRRYALDYESACNRLHTAASLGGFLLWINDLARREQDAQGSGESEDAVKVLTYHRSKGLEYPVVICHSLEQNLKEQIWGINLVAETEEPDLDNILANRKLRFWVNPYADQLGRTRLEENLHQSQEWLEATRTALEEEARLLYVGLTRARDYLIFPTTVKPAKWLNRVFNNGEESIPTLDPMSDETPFYWDGEVIRCETEPLYKPPVFPEAPPDSRPVDFHADRRGKHLKYRPLLEVDVLREMPPGPDPGFGDPQAFGSWLEFKGEFQPALVKAAQSVMMADLPGLTDAQRLKMAQNQLFIRQVQDQLRPEALLEHSAAFHKWLKQEFAPAAMDIKFPMEGLHGQRHVQLSVDCWMADPKTPVILFFAGFAEGMKKWKQQAQQFAPLAGWARILAQQQFPGSKPRCWLVFPLEAQAVEVLER